MTTSEAKEKLIGALDVIQRLAEIGAHSEADLSSKTLRAILDDIAIHAKRLADEHRATA